MKTFIALSLFFLYLSSINANELSWVDEQVKAIKPARSGIDNSMINEIKDPFVFLKKNGYIAVKKKKISKKTVKKTKITKKPIKKYRAKLMLEMIVNSSALINGNWYKVGDKVKGYTLTGVDKDYITLLIDGKKSVLSMISKKSTLKFKRK